MTPIRTFNTRVEADLARIALGAEGIEATVVGLDVALEGGAGGVRLLVVDKQAAEARKSSRKRYPARSKSRGRLTRAVARPPVARLRSTTRARRP